MANEAVTVPPTAKKDKASTAPKHPPTSEMVNAAIEGLNERSGSSLYAIKKYMSANYMIDVEKLSRFIKIYLKSAVASGQLKQTKGNGATGSFKLNASEQKKSAAKKSKHVTGEEKAKAKKPSAEKKKSATESGEKKKAAASPKAKANAANPKVKAPRTKAQAMKASPKKVAKVSKEKSTKPKAAAVKVKTPKPKKAASPAKKAAPKKAAEPKKAA